MKKILFLSLAFIFAMPVFATGKHLSALFGYSTFYIPGNNQPYVETYLNFNAWSLNFEKEADGQYRATVEVTLVIKNSDTVAFLKKYDLHSPYTNSTKATNFTFLDLQRFGLGNGIYDLELTLHDKASKDAPTTFNDKIVVFYMNGKAAMSNIQLMSSATPTQNENMLSRNGYDMVPYIDDFIPADITQLHPYVEIYNLDQELNNKPYTVLFSIEQKENGHRLIPFSNRIDHPKTMSTDPIYGTIDISSLPSGNYDLVAEVLDYQNNVLLRKNLSFQRSNPKAVNNDLTEAAVATSFAGLITDPELLNYYITALYPISSHQEIIAGNEVIHQPDVAEKQSYFYHFWLNRNAVDPAGEWNEYLERLTYVDKHFSYPETPGYRTDMGRVYLQYGAPDFVRDEKNFVGSRGSRPSADAGNTEGIIITHTVAEDFSGNGHIHYLPYQLWRYNVLPGNDANRVFIFWDEFRSGYYLLLNSNARGETRTYNWERVLSRNQLGEGCIGAVGEQFERGY